MACLCVPRARIGPRSWQSSGRPFALVVAQRLLVPKAVAILSPPTLRALLLVASGHLPNTDTIRQHNLLLQPTRTRQRAPTVADRHGASTSDSTALTHQQGKLHHSADGGHDGRTLRVIFIMAIPTREIVRSTPGAQLRRVVEHTACGVLGHPFFSSGYVRERKYEQKSVFLPLKRVLRWPPRGHSPQSAPSCPRDGLK